VASLLPADMNAKVREAIAEAVSIPLAPPQPPAAADPTPTQRRAAPPTTTTTTRKVAAAAGQTARGSAAQKGSTTGRGQADTAPASKAKRASPTRRKSPPPKALVPAIVDAEQDIGLSEHASVRCILTVSCLCGVVLADCVQQVFWSAARR
jgi:hypothetical protein